MKTFLKRTFSSVILLTLFFTAIFNHGTLGKSIFGLLVVLLSFFSVREFTTILIGSDNKANRNITPAFAALTALFAVLQWYNFAIVAAVAFIVIQWSLFLLSKNQMDAMRSILNSTAAYFLFAVPIVLLTWLYHCSPYIFLYLVLITKISDIGAYIVGTVTNALSKGGNHKMIPSISPGKSYEGAVGGILCAMGASYIIWPMCKFGLPLWLSLVAGAILFFGSMAGDLAESAFKRTCGVKDSGHVIPGIGGVFDLVDSLLINGAVFAIFLYFLR
ncbi:MAG: phosphatidate cytidylyltransferase [Lentisphaeria bacterium]|nr:phosphatidate cytidylyltransferase [Lentisphaeria bacterium]